MIDGDDGVRVYPHGDDSVARDGVPAGRVETFRLETSSIFPGTSRTVHVYLPPGDPDALMVFQDGALYLDPSLDMRVGTVFDNLIADGSMPPTVGVFVDPGVLEDGSKHRNAEYDPADGRYASLLIDEVLPAVRQVTTVTGDPARTAISGGSSGGNCAFTAAWHRPDRFGKVLGFVSSFAQIPGGDPYPEWIRTADPKPLRVFLQANRFDLGHDQAEGNWYAENLLVAAALAERGYDHRLVLGDGAHSPNHGGAILPEALRWLWR